LREIVSVELIVFSDQNFTLFHVISNGYYCGIAAVDTAGDYLRIKISKKQ
jgi:hypothetical protein